MLKEVLKGTVVKLLVFHLTEGNSATHKDTLWTQIQQLFKGGFEICNGSQGSKTLENTEADSEIIIFIKDLMSPYPSSTKGHIISPLSKRECCSISEMKHE